MLPRIRVPSLLLLTFVLLACGDAGPVHPTLDLPRVGTVGANPDPSDRPTLVVNLFAEGRVAVEGTDLDFPGLAARLLAHADLQREEKSPRRWSETQVVFRCDRDVPWRNAQWAMQAAAAPESRITRLFFAVRPEQGGEEGSLAILLPRDDGLARSRIRVAPVPAAAVRVSRRLGSPAEPVDLHATFEKLYPGRSAEHAVLWADGDVSTGYVLRTLDHLLRRGIADIRLRGAPLPDPSEGLHSARESRGARGAGILIDGRPVAAGDSVRTPAPEGVVSSGPAGITEWDVGVDLTTDWGHDGLAEDDEIFDVGLAWLAARQHPDGYWTGAGDGADTEVTALALFAFLAAGENHRNTPHKQTVKNGLKFLKQHQAGDGAIRMPDEDAGADSRAVPALALIEAFRNTLSPLFKQAARLAIEELSTGTSRGPWTTLALISAEEAGLRAGKSRAGDPVIVSVNALPDWTSSAADPEAWFLTARTLGREGGPRWKTWWTALRAAVLAGRQEDGAWESAGKHGPAATTALALLCLMDWSDEEE